MYHIRNYWWYHYTACHILPSRWSFTSSPHLINLCPVQKWGPQQVSVGCKVVNDRLLAEANICTMSVRVTHLIGRCWLTQYAAAGYSFTCYCFAVGASLKENVWKNILKCMIGLIVLQLIIIVIIFFMINRLIDKSSSLKLWWNYEKHLSKFSRPQRHIFKLPMFFSS